MMPWPAHSVTARPGPGCPGPLPPGPSRVRPSARQPCLTRGPVFPPQPRLPTRPLARRLPYTESARSPCPPACSGGPQPARRPLAVSHGHRGPNRSQQQGAQPPPNRNRRARARLVPQGRAEPAANDSESVTVTDPAWHLQSESHY